ncbi:uncharacterized protein ACHE_30794A [Aspergillus chevalieri]|uniref:Uncharacterized protein n=1 Tax=Aspergillus chevalieri TaxID=182096 RepID=A0A7R7ZN21_ASPCH|nr:uncharacterized protein ACHE_30794A [Aspergillus chevalieri]BCR86807.1 hypothetical protein ACHE_30794A [Aspergillus chevalieri]
MASQDAGLQPLDPKLFSEDDDDDEEDLFWKRKLKALINGDMTPSQAATDFDLCIVEEANTRHAELLKRPDPRSLAAEEEKNGAPITVRSHRIPAAISSLSSRGLPSYSLLSHRITRTR